MIALVNSLPKSGTHLLERALMLLGLRNWEATRSFPRRVTDRLGLTPPSSIQHRAAATWERARLRTPNYSPDAKHMIPIGVFSPCYFDEASFSKWISRRPSESLLKAHLPYHPDTARLLDEFGVRPVTIIRDPRAVAASMIQYVLDARHWKHFLQDHFDNLSEDQRVDFVVDGGISQPHGVPVLPLAQAFSSVLDWGQHTGNLMIRFEDLVGPHGGGTAEAMETTLIRIADHLNIDMTAEMKARMDVVFDPSSPTFRGGQIDGWRKRLTPHQVSMIEDRLGPELFARAGYALDAA